jgi:hypothetical protein
MAAGRRGRERAWQDAQFTATVANEPPSCGSIGRPEPHRWKLLHALLRRGNRSARRCGVRHRPGDSLVGRVVGNRCRDLHGAAGLHRGWVQCGDSDEELVVDSAGTAAATAPDNGIVRTSSSNTTEENGEPFTTPRCGQADLDRRCPERHRTCGTEQKSAGVIQAENQETR